MLRTTIDLVKENCFILKKTGGRQYPTEATTGSDYADDPVLLKKNLLNPNLCYHSLEQAASCFGLYLSSEKTEIICLNQDGVISSLNGKPLKLVDKFIYLGGDISSTKNDINIDIGRIDCYWLVIEHMEIWSHWKSKTAILPRCSRISTTVWL